MNKQELRIGNWVAFKKKPKGGFDYTTLTKSCFEGDYIEKTFKPILLTKDWMVRFGFLNIVEGNIWVKKLSTHYEYYYNYSSENRDKYVHELQNSFFKLNKEELIYEKSRTN